MTSVRSLRALTASALLLVAGCFPHAASISGPQSSPAPSPTPEATHAPAATVRSSPRSLSTAPVYVIRSSAPGKSVPSTSEQGTSEPETPVPLPSVSPYGVIPSVAPKARSRGTALHMPMMPIVDNEPHILAIHISTLEIHSGETVSGYVTTSKNVSAVDIHISAWSMPLPKTHAGLFRASGVIPDLPFFVKGNYTLQVIARVGNDLTTERDIPISLR